MTMRKIVVENDLTAEEKELHNIKGVRFYLNNRAYISVYYDHLGNLKIGGMGDIANLTHQLVIAPSSANLLTVALQPADSEK